MSDSPYSGAELRRSGLQFLSGKVMTAALTFAALLTIVRILPTRDYGVYATLGAWLELTIAIAGIGIPWMGGRYIPEFRLHASGVALRRLSMRLLSWLAMALAAAAVCAGVLLDQFLQWSDLALYRNAAAVYLVVLFVEGLGRLVIASLLDPLMQQQVVRASVILRQCSMLAALGAFALVTKIRLIEVIYADLLGATLCASTALLGLWRHLASLAARPGKPAWQQPAAGAMWHTGLNMYGAYVLTLVYSPQVLLTLVTRFLGAEAAAAFGFMRSLYDQIARYLPATLLFNLVRPKLIASYFAEGDASELTRNANLAGKLSLFVLMPLIAFIGAAEGHLVTWLSGARLTDTGLLFFGFALALIPLSQRQLMESVAVAVGDSRLCLVAAASGLLTVPILAVLAHFGLGLWGAVAAIGIGQVLFNGTIVAGLLRAIGYRPDLVGALKLAGSAALAYLAGVALPLPSSAADAWALPVRAVAVVAVFLLVSWLIKPFDSDERARINGLLDRKVFVW